MIISFPHNMCVVMRVTLRFRLSLVVIPNGATSPSIYLSCGGVRLSFYKMSYRIVLVLILRWCKAIVCM